LFHLVFGSHFGKAGDPVPETSEPAKDIDTAAMDSLNALDAERPIGEDRFNSSQPGSRKNTGSGWPVSFMMLIS
jgi:hypothetical protein